eukprot:9020533-Pyramimonas_sp.AAC.1
MTRSATFICPGSNPDRSHIEIMTDKVPKPDQTNAGHARHGNHPPTKPCAWGRSETLDGGPPPT